MVTQGTKQILETWAQSSDFISLKVKTDALLCNTSNSYTSIASKLEESSKWILNVHVAAFEPVFLQFCKNSLKVLYISVCLQISNESKGLLMNIWH